ncbi:MAG: pantoate--beta-alanine ligase [Opitutales bacterium]|nr:pantoate--beta-alanine ligase [Opitutales bacterium]
MTETVFSEPQVFRDIATLQQHLTEVRQEGRKVALVPTMGALHEGHLALVRKALKEAQEVVVTIFVNPKQFGPNEDLASYPRDEETDLKALGKLGKVTVFIPGVEEMYSGDFSTFVDEAQLSKGLCGVSRPQFFRGVLTIVGKLFNIVRPDIAIFGQKDAQQAAVIQKMVRDLHFGVEIITLPTVREEDGLAMSSRNQYLSKAQREEAQALSKSLFEAKEMVEQGVRSTDRVIAEVTHLLAQHRRVRLIYAQVIDTETLEPCREIVPGQSLLALAAWVDQVRLIDNIRL